MNTASDARAASVFQLEFLATVSVTVSSFIFKVKVG